MKLLIMRNGGGRVGSGLFERCDLFVVDLVLTPMGIQLSLSLSLS